MSKFVSSSTGVSANYTSTTTEGSNSYVVTSTPQPSFDFEVEKLRLLNDLNHRKSLEVRTSTLYDKFEEITSTYTPEDFSYLQSLSNRIWKPTNVTDFDLTLSEIEGLKPTIIVAENPTEWMEIRRMISTMSYSKGVGRNIKFYVIDEVTKKILGLAELSSDFGTLKVRDSHIGWSKINRYGEKKLGHTAVGSTIIPTQPFGFNFLGGKLISLLLTSQYVRNIWEQKYGQRLVGITTTSLYGNKDTKTQYDDMKPHWENIGETSGQTSIKPNQQIYSVWKDWLRVNEPEVFDKAMKSSGPKQKVIQIIFKRAGLKVKDFNHGFKRGVYFSKFYTQSFEFLRGESTEVGTETFDSSIDSLVKSWRKRAIRRFKKLFKGAELRTDILFYSDVITSSWETLLFKYLGIKSNTVVKSFTKTNVVSRPTLVVVHTNVSGIINKYFLPVNIREVSSMYYKSFIRDCLHHPKTMFFDILKIN